MIKSKFLKVFVLFFFVLVTGMFMTKEVKATTPQNWNHCDWLVTQRGTGNKDVTIEYYVYIEAPDQSDTVTNTDAEINWGDGTQSAPGMVSNTVVVGQYNGNSRQAVWSDYTYSSPGTYTIRYKAWRTWTTPGQFTSETDRYYQGASPCDLEATVTVTTSTPNTSVACSVENFSADSRDIAYNTSTILRYKTIVTGGSAKWVVKNLTNGSSFEGTGSAGVDASRSTGNLTTSTDYILECYDASGGINNGNKLDYSSEIHINVQPEVVGSNPSGSLSVTDCTIPDGGNSCDTSVSWNVSSPRNGANTAVTRNPGPSPVEPTGLSGTNIANSINYGTTWFFLYHDGEKLDEGPANATCVSSDKWEGGKCVPITPNGPICSANHFECSLGNDSNHNANSNEWTWTCSKNGIDISCQKNKDTCDNGATNFPTCNQCPVGQQLVNGSCVDCAANKGNACNPANICGQTNSGTYQCDGSCSVSAPSDNLCNVDGGWYIGPWDTGNIAFCDASTGTQCCGRNGTQTRTVSCTNPTPAYGGADCPSPQPATTQPYNTPVCPTGTISATSCTIPAGASTCNSFATWTTQNLTTGATEVTRNNPKNTHVSFNTSGTNILSIVNYNASTFFLYHNLYGNPTNLAEANINAACSSGSIWDGSKCKGVPGSLSGILTPVTPTCEIPVGADSCNINFSWNVENPQADSASAVTRNPNNTIVGNGHIGTNVPFVVKHGIVTFYLYNSKSTRELAESTVAANCKPGLPGVGAYWDTGTQKCQTIPTNLCGNGVINSGEQCDDGNQYNGQCPSLCSSICTTRASCVAVGDISINVRPNLIVSGGSSSLTWSWDGGGSCSGVNFNTGGATSSPVGGIPVNPKSTTTYTINCGGTQTAQTTLTVKKKPGFIEL